MNESTKLRIQKGVEYFRAVKPSQWHAGHTLHLKSFLGLVEEYVGPLPQEEKIISEAEKLFQAKAI